MLATTLILLLALLALSLPVAAALGVLGLILDRMYSSLPLTLGMGEVAWSASRDFLLVAIPMFILMGELLLRAGVAERMYGAMVKWLSAIPGGLMHSNIGACAVFAATSGSSVATAATIGTVSLPLVKQHGYNERLFLGTLAAGGTLGILIPPSINMIIYAVLTDSSIPRLYLAGIIPGLVLSGLFMGTIAVLCLLRPEWGGDRIRVLWSERIASLIHLLPPFGIFLVVVGSIYAGLATATEAASLGVIAATALAAGSLREHHENHGDGDADHHRRLFPQFRHHRHWPDCRAHEFHFRPRPVEMGNADRGGRFLSHSRLLHGNAVDDDHHHPDRRAGHVRARLRPDLVRHRHRHPDRDGADHPAGRPQSLRCAVVAPRGDAE
jgi:hypothetical protein